MKALTFILVILFCSCKKDAPVPPKKWDRGHPNDWVDPHKNLTPDTARNYNYDKK